MSKRKCQDCKTDESNKKFKIELGSLDILSCNVCKQLIKGTDEKSKTCENGHPMCGYCYNDGEQESESDPDSDYEDQVAREGTCTRCAVCCTYVFEDNALLTKLVESVKLPCLNSECDKLLTTEAYDSHKDVCIHTPLPCPIDPYDCKWSMSGLDSKEIIDHLLSHNTKPTSGDSKREQVDEQSDESSPTLVSVEMLPTISIGKTVPCFVFTFDERNTNKYYIASIQHPVSPKESGGKSTGSKFNMVTRYVLFSLKIEKMHNYEAVRISSILLPEKSTRFDEAKGDLNYQLGYDVSSIGDLIEAPIDRKTVIEFDDGFIELGHLEEDYPKVFTLCVNQGELDSNNEYLLKCLLMARHNTGATVDDDDDIEQPNGWMNDDPILNAWPDVNAKGGPEHKHPCIECLADHKSTDPFANIAVDELYGICDKHLDKIKGTDNSLVLGTIRGLNILKIKYKTKAVKVVDVIKMSARQVALYDAHRVVVNILY